MNRAAATAQRGDGRSRGGRCGVASRAWRITALLCLWCAGSVAAAAPAVFRTAPGRFEISAADAAIAQPITSAAEDAWRWLAAPLSLPDAFSSAIFVRVVPRSEGESGVPFQTTVEAGGVVSLRIREDSTANRRLIRRALVQALLMRLAAAQHGVTERLTAPLWLEHACVGWWETRADSAQFDLLRQQSALANATTLDELLAWQRGASEPAAWSAGATWLLAFLQMESTRGVEWAGFVRRLLGGEDPAAALAGAYVGRFSSDIERELWWQTGYQQMRRARALPALEIAESRAAIDAILRWIATEGDRDLIVPLREVLVHGNEPFVSAELQRRAAELNRVLPALHPFFRNAGLSLAEVFAALGATPAKHEVAWAAFERDWRAANELAAASSAALDKLEKR